ncbi:MAG: hypothetical protein GY790_11000, partial [Bacteroidetes bacterium]|nr:hypothetical protein [Bacteroidota bacterium]
MKRRKFIGLSAAGIAGTASAVPSVFHAGSPEENSQEPITERELNPNTHWLRDAKWGFFTHYLPHNPSDKISEHMTGELWTKKVNSFNVKRFGQQLSELNTPYFFVTIGQRRGWYCSPNRAFEELFAKNVGRLTERDLVQELAEELVPRGIRMCVYLPNFGRHATPE